MKKACAILASLAAMASFAWGATSSGPTANPASLNFTYQVNTTTLPAAAKMTVSLPNSASTSTVVSVAAAYPPGTPLSQSGWLTVTPASGHAPLALSVVVNPTGLPPGSLKASLTITTAPDIGSLIVPVTLVISNPPARLVVAPGPTTTNFTPAQGTSPDTLSFTYTTGTVWVATQSELDVSTNGGIIPFNVTAAVSSSGNGGTANWLRVAPQGALVPSTQTSGVAVAGSNVPIIVSLDQTTVQGLLPGSYGGTVTLAATSSANGTHTVAVNLVISAGPPVVNTIFPASVVQAPVVNPLITINGQNFFSTSVVTMAPAGASAGGQCTQNGAPIQVSAQLLSQSVLTATIANAQTLLANPGQWCICVTNPAPPNSPG